jgi:hypothetical protein
VELLRAGKEWLYLMEKVKTEEVALVKKAIIDKYGFEASEQYCKDLITFIQKIGEISNVKRE